MAKKSTARKKGRRLKGASGVRIRENSGRSSGRRTARSAELTNDLLARLVEAFSLQHRLRLLVRWTKGRPVTLYMLHVRRKGEPWRDLIGNVLADNDGDHTVEMGDYEEGELAVRVGLFPLENVPKCAVFIAEDNHSVRQVIPEQIGTFLELKRSESTVYTVSYRVGG